MASPSSVWSSLVVTLLVVLNISSASAHLKLLYSPLAYQQDSTTQKEKQQALALEKQPLKPQQFFEISSPPPFLLHHDTPPCLSLPLLKHSFANTINLPPAMATYTPPPSPPCSHNFTHVVLLWQGRCEGRQFDRIAGLWIGGVELLRTSTAEPTKQGIYWTISKDITLFSSLLSSPHLVVLELGNVVDSTYTGIFHIHVSLHFFSSYHSPHSRPVPPPHLILPISLPSPLQQGHWFQISSQTNTGSSSFSFPSNACRALLEIYLSFHGNDEFWYSNPPNDFLISNNITDVPGNGPFREVQVFLDDKLVGAVWPFPVVYTGGINPLLWRPAAAIGAFNLPTYEIELTPFVGTLVDGREHTITFKVEDVAGVWLIDANLHVWLDQNSKRTSGKLIQYKAPAHSPVIIPRFQGLNGTFHTTAHRSLMFSGYVISSMGNVTWSSAHFAIYDNVLVFKDNFNTEKVTQTIHSKVEVLAMMPSEVVFSQEASYSFPLHLVCRQSSGANESTLDCDFDHSFNSQISTFSTSGSSFSSLKNSQKAEGTLKTGLVTTGVGALQQKYILESSNGCYERTLNTRNYTILHDSSNTSCTAIV